MEMSSVEVLKRLCELDFGVAIVPQLAVSRELQARTLARVRVPALASERSVGLLTPTAGPPAPAAAAFAALARELLRAQRRVRPRRGRTRGGSDARE
jgi:DNA-binding transcriptional LysR family regulator